VDEALTIVDRVLQANKEDPSLDKYRERADGEDKDWMLEKRRLLFQGRLVVPDQDDLYTKLLDEIH
jgi:hypothetical protein